MATAKTCDRCGQINASALSAALGMEGLARPETVTGTSMTLDVCATCRPHGIAVLHKHIVEMLREQGPFHTQIDVAAAARDTARAELDAFRSSQVYRDAYHEAEREAAAAVKATPDTPRPNPVTLLPPHITAKVDELRTRAEKAEEQRVAIAREATRVSDSRLEVMRRDLRQR